MVEFTAKVIAYYTPPKTKDGVQPPVERHQMWKVDFAEAQAGAEGKCWSLAAPKDGTPIADKVPPALNLSAPKSNPPPVVERPE